MRNEDFFTFGSKLSPSTVQAHAKGLKKNADSDGLYDEHRLIRGTYVGINFPVVFEQEYGKKLEDILDTGWPGLFLISNKMREVLLDGNLTGWTAFPIKLLDKRGCGITGYYGLSILGKCGPIDYSKSEIIEKRLVPHGPLGKYYRGLHIGLDQWDNSDFFLPEKNWGTIITCNAAQLLLKSKLTNIKLKNLSTTEDSVF